MDTAARRYMQRALTLAKKGVGRTAPNPAVGCVVVRDGVVVGEGWHRRAGTPHAEVHALAMAAEKAHGSDVYVTLEPCSHTGRTPPCCDALLAAGVARVFVGMIDPNPQVAGRGIARLQQANVSVFVGLLEDRCRALNPGFIKQMTTGLPYVLYKAALTLDGFTATVSHDSRWVSGPSARREVHRLRNQLDAVMVGVDTVVHDNPQLTVRDCRGRNPWRIVVDSQLRTPVTSKIVTDNMAVKTIFVTTVTDPVRVAGVTRHGAQVMTVQANACGQVSLEIMLRALAMRGISSILCEGGATLAGALLEAGLIDCCLFFTAPKLLFDGQPAFRLPGVGRMADAWTGQITSLKMLDGDIMVQFIPKAGGSQCSRD